MDHKLWQKAEDAFQLMAFHEYYRKSEEKNNSLRFAHAIIDSSRPITTAQQRQAIMQWYEGKGQRTSVSGTIQGEQ